MFDKAVSGSCFWEQPKLGSLTMPQNSLGLDDRANERYIVDVGQPEVRDYISSRRHPRQEHLCGLKLNKIGS